MSSLAKRENAHINPMMAVPTKLIPAVTKFALFFGDFFKDRGSLSVRIKHWIDEGHCVEEDALDAMRAMMTPARAAGLEYVGQIHSALAQEIEKAKAERKADERRREAAAARDSEPLSENVRRRVHDYASEIGRMP